MNYGQKSAEDSTKRNLTIAANGFSSDDFYWYAHIFLIIWGISMTLFFVFAVLCPSKTSEAYKDDHGLLEWRRHFPIEAQGFICLEFSEKACMYDLSMFWFFIAQLCFIFIRLYSIFDTPFIVFKYCCNGIWQFLSEFDVSVIYFYRCGVYSCFCTQFWSSIKPSLFDY